MNTAPPGLIARKRPVRKRPQATANGRASSDGVPLDVTVSPSVVTYALPDAVLGKRKMAKNWRARQHSNLQPKLRSDVVQCSPA